MNSNVRRLVLDFAPYLQNTFGLVLWLTAGIQDFEWLAGRGGLPIVAAFVPYMTSVLYVPKVPVWRTLPVSRRELGQAQWWNLWGRPLILATIVMAGSWGLAAATHVQVAPDTALTALAGQMAVLLGSGLILPAAAIFRRLFGVTGYFIALMGGVGVLIGAMFASQLFSTVPTADIRMAGLASLAAIAVLYLASGALPLALPHMPGSRKARPETRSTQPGPRGWTALAQIMAWRVAMLVGLLLVAGLVARFALTDAGGWLRALPIFGVITSLTTVPALPPRTLAGLPVSVGTRVMLVQMVPWLFQIPAAVVTIAVTACIAPEQLTPLWLCELAFITLALISLTALLMACGLRFGYRGAMVLMGFVTAVAGVMVGFLAGSLGPGHPDLPAPVVSGAVAILAGLWLLSVVWTWAELARGRAAYRFMGEFTRWRGNA